LSTVTTAYQTLEAQIKMCQEVCVCVCFQKRAVDFVSSCSSNYRNFNRYIWVWEFPPFRLL